MMLMKRRDQDESAQWRFCVRCVPASDAGWPPIDVLGPQTPLLAAPPSEVLLWPSRMEEQRPGTDNKRSVALERALFTSPVVLVEAVARDVDHLLFAEELEHVKRAVAKRRQEFGTARVCARKALAALGVAPVPLVPGADRAPVWPPGIVGSIAHTHRLCAVVVGRSPPLRGLGIDVEQVRSLPTAVISTILTTGEASFVNSFPAANRDLLIILHFSAKEAYYKCQYAVARSFLGFQDVAVDIDFEAHRFLARRLVTGPALLERLPGRFVLRDGTVICGVEAPSETRQTVYPPGSRTGPVP